MYSHILISAVAQHFLGWLWYHGIFFSIFSYYSAADKGVKRAEHIKVRFSETVCLLGTLLAGVGRSLAIYAMAKNLALTTCWQYQEAAVMVAVAVCLAYHHGFWAQRPLPLLLINGGYELASSLLGAVVLHCLVGVNIF